MLDNLSPLSTRSLEGRYCQEGKLPHAASLDRIEQFNQIREEDNVPEIPFSNEGRDFGTIKVRVSLRTPQGTYSENATELQC